MVEVKNRKKSLHRDWQYDIVIFKEIDDLTKSYLPELSLSLFYYCLGVVHYSAEIMIFSRQLIILL
jgi:hypothetical protein